MSTLVNRRPPCIFALRSPVVNIPTRCGTENERPSTPSTGSERCSPKFAPTSGQNFSRSRVKIITSRGCQTISIGSSGCWENSVSSSGSAIPPRSRPASQEAKVRGRGCPTPTQAAGRSGSAATAVGSAFDVSFLLDRWPVDLGNSCCVVTWGCSDGGLQCRQAAAGAAEVAIRINPHWLRWYLRRLTPRVRSV